MQASKNITGIILMLMICFNTACLAQDIPKYISELTDRELEFSKTSSQKGIRAAFLSVLHPNGVVFRPEPVNGKSFFKNRKDEIPGQLIWEPTWVEVSSDETLGYTTGPFEYRNDPVDNANVNYGQYASIWVKEKRKWELMVDLGISHAKPPFTPQLTFQESNPEYKRSVLSYVAEEQQKNSQELLKATDELYCTNLNSGSYANSFKEFLGQNVRLLRNNNLPIIGKSTAMKYLNGIKATYNYKPNVAYVAPSRDLGYTYGTATITTTVKKKLTTLSYNYVRVWRKEEHGYWRIVLDVESPIPPKKQ